MEERPQRPVPGQLDQPTDERLERIHRPMVGAEHPTVPGLKEALASGRLVEVGSGDDALATPNEIRWRSWWKQRWMAISIVGILLVVGYLLGGSLTEGHRNQKQIDKVRLPVCAVMYTALSHAPATQAQADVRRDYLQAYGPDGLKCPKPLPATVS